jgi:biopolymer transport protein TolR
VIERYLNSFSLAFFGVVVTVFVLVFAGTPIVCGLRPTVRLPWAHGAVVLSESETDLAVYLKQDKTVFVGPVAVPLRDLSHELRRINLRHMKRHLLLSADGRVPFGSVQEILRAVRDAGCTKVTLVTFRGTRLEAWQHSGAV